MRLRKKIRILVNLFSKKNRFEKHSFFKKWILYETCFREADFGKNCASKKSRFPSITFRVVRFFKQTQFWRTHVSRKSNSEWKIYSKKSDCEFEENCMGRFWTDKNYDASYSWNTNFRTCQILDLKNTKMQTLNGNCSFYFKSWTRKCAQKLTFRIVLFRNNSNFSKLAFLQKAPICCENFLESIHLQKPLLASMQKSTLSFESLWQWILSN